MAKRWTAIGKRLDGRAGSWALVSDMRMVVRHCGHPTALRPYYAEFNGWRLTMRDLCRSVAAVRGWKSTEEDFAQAAPQLLAVRHLREMQDIAEHWLNTTRHCNG